jgi:CRP-like cAMP-binding protein
MSTSLAGARTFFPVRETENRSRSLGAMLGKLPRVELDLLHPKLDLVPLKMHQVLHEAGDKIRFGYFVEMGLLSIVSIQPNGKSVEVGLIGTGGFAGMPVVDGFSTSPHRCIVQTDGTAYRIEAAALRDVLRSCPELHAELHRYGQYLALQAMQIAACNGLHEVEARLARWLLMGQELHGSNELPLTQDLLGQMLGTRRSSVSLAASTLHRAGIIAYRRGKVTILDTAKLQSVACKCYELMKSRLDAWSAECQQEYLTS